MDNTNINSESNDSKSDLVSPIENHVEKEVNLNENEISIKKWDELDLDSNILRGIYSHGFENPSPIQSKGILPIMKGKDMIAQSQSGTGKTVSGASGTADRNR